MTILQFGDALAKTDEFLDATRSRRWFYLSSPIVYLCSYRTDDDLLAVCRFPPTRDNHPYTVWLPRALVERMRLRYQQKTDT